MQPRQKSRPSQDPADKYRHAIERTEAMPSDATAQALAAEHGLQILNVTWEDTGRFKNSAVGPNISDMTIQVQYPQSGTGRFELACMPVIRFPNFSDVTADIRPEQFYVLTGNERSAPLSKIDLAELLQNIRRHLTNADSWGGTKTSLFAPQRDGHVLVSAQACFLPIPAEATAQFNPVLFNYQSRAGDPAVLTILATREGTSVTVIDNERDAFEAGDTWGQRLFFNQAGQRASLTGRRRSEFVRDQKNAVGDGSTQVEVDRDGLNMVLLIQVPLQQKSPPPAIEDTCILYCAAPLDGGDVEDAVIGHGPVEGPFTEIDGLEIERDERFPIRVTVQFYKATSDGVVRPEDFADIAARIRRVYDEADYVGSLVLENTNRPTEHTGPKREPPDWWERFWERRFAETGKTKAETIEILRGLFGDAWSEQDESGIQAGLKQVEES